jgi:hypothetical protein
MKQDPTREEISISGLAQKIDEAADRCDQRALKEALSECEMSIPSHAGHRFRRMPAGYSD